MLPDGPRASFKLAHSCLSVAKNHLLGSRDSLSCACLLPFFCLLFSLLGLICFCGHVCLVVSTVILDSDNLIQYFVQAFAISCIDYFPMFVPHLASLVVQDPAGINSSMEMLVDEPILLM